MYRPDYNGYVAENDTNFFVLIQKVRQNDDSDDLKIKFLSASNVAALLVTPFCIVVLLYCCNPFSLVST